jgi:hypothetical protein
MKEFKFFRGFDKPTLTEEFERLLRDYQPVTLPTINPILTLDNPNWGRIATTNPIWQVNPGLIQYQQPNYTIYNTPGTGTYTIPYNGTTNFTATGTSLTTSNPNGITYTTGGFGGTLTTGTATFNNSILK